MCVEKSGETLQFLHTHTLTHTLAYQQILRPVGGGGATRHTVQAWKYIADIQASFSSLCCSGKGHVNPSSMLFYVMFGRHSLSKMSTFPEMVFLVPRWTCQMQWCVCFTHDRSLLLSLSLQVLYYIFVISRVTKMFLYFTTYCKTYSILSLFLRYVEHLLTFSFFLSGNYKNCSTYFISIQWLFKLFYMMIFS